MNSDPKRRFIGATMEKKTRADSVISERSGASDTAAFLENIDFTTSGDTASNAIVTDGDEAVDTASNVEDNTGLMLMDDFADDDPLGGKTTAPASNTTATSKPPPTGGAGDAKSRSSSMSIPVPNPLSQPHAAAAAGMPPSPLLMGLQQQQQQQQQQQGGQGSSFGSSGSGFLSSVLNNNNNTAQAQQQAQSALLSHTPPAASSYEVSHFGKRARSGSISGRLRSASEHLEQKGLLDRQTKGILKDLIIIGDEVLQKALDQYETQGDATALEQMVSSGALQERLPQDLDLLGDIDLDFLTVNDSSGAAAGGGGGADVATSAAGLGSDNIEALPESVVGSAVAAHPGMPPGSSVIPVGGVLKDDGIGELDFAGDFVDDHGSDRGGGGDSAMVGASSSSYMTNQLPQQTTQQQQQQLPPSMGSSPQTLTEYERRNRSNSLFTALWNTTTNPDCGVTSSVDAGGGGDGSILPPTQESSSTTIVTADGSTSSSQQQQQYGSWMQGYHAATADIDSFVSPSTTAQQQEAHPQPVTSSIIAQPTGIGAAQQQQQGIRIAKPTKTGNPRGRPSNASKAAKNKAGLLGASLEAERKRKEKEERKALREQKKLEKLQKKQKKKDAAAAAAAGMDVEMFEPDNHGSLSQDEGETSPIHIPGSGRPRSLSDPNLRISMTDDGFRHVERPDDWVGAYSPESRKVRISRFLEKRNHRVWTKTVKYDVRKNFADSRLRVKGRFVKKEEELLMRELMSLT